METNHKKTSRWQIPMNTRPTSLIDFNMVHTVISKGEIITWKDQALYSGLALKGEGLVEIGLGLVGPTLLEEQLAVGGKGLLYDNTGICACVLENVQVDLLPFLIALEVETSTEEVQSYSNALELVVAYSLFETEFEEEGAFVYPLQVEE